jgi:dTDP-4-amino-4,6-dideoxygalactose transaminase
MSVQTAARTIPVSRPFFGPEEEQAVAEVLRSGWVAQGPRVAAFEKAFAQRVGAEHAIAVSSCATALHLVMSTFALKPGDEVICPSLSFIATANSIVHAGGTPVFADVIPDTYNIDPEAIERAVTPRTRAIMAVHQVGQPAAMNEILAVAARHKLPVVEDAAPAVGAEYFGRAIGAPHGLIACFSFDGRKVLSSGEGGVITTNDGDLAARLRRLRTQAMTVSDAVRHDAKNIIFETYEEVAHNFRLTDMQAAVATVQLGRLQSFLTRRRHLASRYSEALQAMGWCIPPVEPKGYFQNYQSYMARLTPDAPIGRDALMQALLDRGISTRRGVMAIHRETPYRNPRWEKELVHTQAVSDNSIILPLYQAMTEQDQDYVIDNIQEVSKRAAHQNRS